MYCHRMDPLHYLCNDCGQCYFLIILVLKTYFFYENIYYYLMTLVLKTLFCMKTVYRTTLIYLKKIKTLF
jgi:hypothetical protein